MSDSQVDHQQAPQAVPWPLDGQPVEILGLEIHAGDLLYADCHGVTSIPPNIARDIPEAAAKIRAPEKLLRVIQNSH